MATLHGARIVLGVTGSIAAFKAAQLCSTLVQQGAEVDVVLTAEAQRFITPLTFHALTRRPVWTDMYDVPVEMSAAHLSVAERAQVLLVCPASATTLSRLAAGSAEDMLSCTALACTAPLVIAPAMNVHMWQHPATQANVHVLRKRGALFVGPVEGRLAEGVTGMGRLAPLEDVIAGLRTALGRAGGSPLAGKHVVVSAGGTHEPLDPVRFVGNRSSGKMGYAIAEAARDRGARVTLVSGPVALPAPWGMEVRRVETAEQMLAAVLDSCADASALVMAAAVADFRPREAAEHKIKKQGDGDLVLTLTQNPDILARVHAAFGDKLVKVGFAAESRDVIAAAAKKLTAKGLHLICANDVTEPGSGFGTDTNRVTILSRDGSREDLPLLSKDDVADHIWDRVEGLLA